MFPEIYTGHLYTIMFKSHQGKQVTEVLRALQRQLIPNHAIEIDPQSLYFRRYNILKTRSLRFSSM
jgi:hypothetical protein